MFVCHVRLPDDEFQFPYLSLTLSFDVFSTCRQRDMGLVVGIVLPLYSMQLELFFPCIPGIWNCSSLLILVVEIVLPLYSA